MDRSAGALLDARRLSLALRSAAALIFAVAFLWPALGEAALIRLFALYAFIDGVLAVSPGGWRPDDRAAWPLLLGGLADLAAAAFAYAWPEIGLFGLAMVATTWAIAQAASFALAWVGLRAADGTGLLLLSGIAAAVFARSLLSNLAGDAIVLSTWIGLYALTVGILFFKLTLQRYRFAPADASGAFR